MIESVANKVFSGNCIVVGGSVIEDVYLGFSFKICVVVHESGKRNPIQRCRM